MNSVVHKNKNLLIINRIQFGYHTDTYYYSKLLRDRFEITYVCFDQSLEKVQIDNTNLIYVSTRGNYLIRGFRYFRTIANELKKKQYDIIFVKYFPGVSLLSYFIDKKKTILDIRTGSVFHTKKKRIIGDLILKLETNFYRHLSVISEGLANKLNLKNVNILPLGAEVISSKEKIFENVNLLYVGTFYNRNIETTIDAVARFVNEINTDITYTIVGFGTKQEEETIKSRIKEYGLDNLVKFVGRVRVNELFTYFDACNVGVTYIPITDYFDHQPPTKLFEYALSGMINIATATEINKAYINERNGIICDDSIDGFFNALSTVYKNLNQYNSKMIKESLSDYSWDSIVQNKLTPILLELVNQQ